MSQVYGSEKQTEVNEQTKRVLDTALSRRQIDQQGGSRYIDGWIDIDRADSKRYRGARRQAHARLTLRSSADLTLKKCRLAEISRGDPTPYHH